MTFDSSRTFHAGQAMQLSELISLKFSGQRLGKAPPRVVRLTEPDGPSTDGGRKARQSMLLVPETGDGNALLFGFLDVGKRAAEIRSYAALCQQYEARFGGSLDVSDEEYGKLLGTMRDFLMQQNVSFELVENAPPARAPERAPSVPPKARGASAVTARPPVESKFPVVHVSLAWFAGLVMGYVLCWLKLRL